MPVLLGPRGVAGEVLGVVSGGGRQQVGRRPLLQEAARGVPQRHAGTRQDLARHRRACLENDMGFRERIPVWGVGVLAILLAFSVSSTPTSAMLAFDRICCCSVLVNAACIPPTPHPTPPSMLAFDRTCGSSVMVKAACRPGALGASLPRTEAGRRGGGQQLRHLVTGQGHARQDDAEGGA